ncbi:hypothetical protein ICA_02799 [Bacillus cereus BAG1O-3]|nr:hypothetical protein ICA_02799 [Bacillus cereus BAG1O-3]PGX81380.1 hypothetical protein COE45_16475 [Bacillus thuringiensis]
MRVYDKIFKGKIVVREIFLKYSFFILGFAVKRRFFYFMSLIIFFVVQKPSIFDEKDHNKRVGSKFNGLF